MGLWAGGALAIRFLREVLRDGLLPFCPRYGRRLFRKLRLVLVYVMAGIAIVWGAETIQLPDDVQAFIRFAVSISIV